MICFFFESLNICMYCWWLNDSHIRLYSYIRTFIFTYHCNFLFCFDCCCYYRDDWYFYLRDVFFLLFVLFCFHFITVRLCDSVSMKRALDSRLYQPQHSDSISYLFLRAKNLNHALSKLKRRRRRRTNKIDINHMKAFERTHIVWNNVFIVIIKIKMISIAFNFNFLH